jgi:hypothetical protein
LAAVVVVSLIVVGDASREAARAGPSLLGVLFSSTGLHAPCRTSKD